MSREAFELPKMFCLRQSLPPAALADVEGSVASAIEQAEVAKTILPGDRVAIAVGSRGISNLRKIVRVVVRSLEGMSARPFVVPAMGSHGGATPRGQEHVLRTLGVTSQTIRCPIVSSMTTEVIGSEIFEGEPHEIHFGKEARQADHVLVINRVKPHTRITGSLQSGLVKMALVGLGKHSGAASCHRLFGKSGYRLDAIAESILAKLVAKTPLRFGLAIIEDAAEQTSHVECVPVTQWAQREPPLLEKAWQRMPGLPFKKVDWLMVDQIGKEISGTGMDTNVIGRKSNDLCAAEHEWPKVREIYVRSLSERTNGNATGVGLAKYVHARVLEQMDRQATRINCEASDHASAGKVHQVVASDQEAMNSFASEYASVPTGQWRWLAIPDTLSLRTIWCSEAFYHEADSRSGLEVLSRPEPIRFRESGEWIIPGASDVAGAGRTGWGSKR